MARTTSIKPRNKAKSTSIRPKKKTSATLKSAAKKKGVASSKKWSSKVKTKWKSPAGLFKSSAGKIASTLKKNSKDLKQAMSRLNFYINRAGKNLSASDKKRLNAAKAKLRSLYTRK